MKRFPKSKRILVTPEIREYIRKIDGFRVAARSADGIIEAIERPDLPFFVGVHWHPERLASSETTRRLLRAFVDATRGAWQPA